MKIKGISNLLILAALVAGGWAGGYAQQAADGSTMFPGRRREPPPLAVTEAMQRMRIEKEKKDHEEMIDRGNEVLQLAEDVERAFTLRGSLSDGDRTKVASIEKMTRKIRRELGGSDDDDDDAIIERGTPRTVVERVAALMAAAISLNEELKKTTRFSISASAVESSNTLIRAARTLRES